MEEVLYADLNNDGMLDQVRILLESRQMDPNDQWVWKIAHKMLKEQEELKAKGAAQEVINSVATLCHAMALTGLPATEDLFSVSLCGDVHERVGEHPAVAADSIAPIVVESFNGRQGTRDIVIALNNGMVHRLHGTTGRREWQVTGRFVPDFPTWETHDKNALLTRVQSDQVASAVRPILLVGENSMAILSAKNGGVLSSAIFPQTSVARPILASVSGDKTTDVMILSSDAVWGFQIVVRPGAPIVLRVLVGLLLMGLMLAVLRNRFGQKTDKRSTDE